MGPHDGNRQGRVGAGRGVRGSVKLAERRGIEAVDLEVLAAAVADHTDILAGRVFGDVDRSGPGGKRRTSDLGQVPLAAST